MKGKSIMRKIIDLCLDMPDFEEDLIRVANQFCLPENKAAWSGYRENFNGGIEKKLGLTFAKMDATLENEGREAFTAKVAAAAKANAPTLESFIKEMGLHMCWRFPVCIYPYLEVICISFYEKSDCPIGEPEFRLCWYC